MASKIEDGRTSAKECADVYTCVVPAGSGLLGVADQGIITCPLEDFDMTPGDELKPRLGSQTRLFFSHEKENTQCVIKVCDYKEGLKEIQEADLSELPKLKIKMSYIYGPIINRRLKGE